MSNTIVTGSPEQLAEGHINVRIVRIAADKLLGTLPWPTESSTNLILNLYRSLTLTDDLSDDCDYCDHVQDTLVYIAAQLDTLARIADPTISPGSLEQHMAVATPDQIEIFDRSRDNIRTEVEKLVDLHTQYYTQTTKGGVN